MEVLDDTTGLDLANTRVRFLGEPLRFRVGPGILGRVFGGVGQIIDGGPPLAASRALPIEGRPIKPVAREAPREFLETGFSSIDLMNSMVRGQKLPLFSGGGLPHERMAVDIVSNACWPRYALTATEYLAFDEGKQVLVVLTDMTNYLRGPARGLRQPWRSAQPQGLSGLSVLGSGQPVRACGAYPRTPGFPHPTAHTHHAQ